MTILIIGDPHFKPTTVNETRLLRTRVLATIKKYTPTAAIVLGDVLDQHAKIHMKQLDDAMEFIRAIAEKCPVYVLVGNHDIANNACFLPEVNSLRAFRFIKNATIVDRPIRVSIDNLNCVLCPYVPNGRLEEALSDSHFNGDVLFCHQEFRGCLLSSFRRADGSLYETRSETGDDVHSLRFSLIISGHIHQHSRSTIRRDDGSEMKLIYAGTPYQISFAEDEKKYLLLLEEDMRVRYVLTQIRPKKTIECNVDELESLLHDLSLESHSKSRQPQYRVKVLASASECESARVKLPNGRTSQLKALIKRRPLENVKIDLRHELATTQSEIQPVAVDEIDFINELRAALTNKPDLLRLLDSYLS